MKKIIEVNQLTRYYGSVCAVREVSFSLIRGEILGFLGPNGAGKTTTMQMICGNLAPTAGEIRINGVDVLDEPRKAKRSLGYLPEIPPVYRDLTVDEFLGYCARLHGLQGNAQRKAVDVAKGRTGLGDVGRRLIGNLSKGFQQRVGIAQAIIHMPLVIILDEPTVGLDPIQIHEIRELIRELGQEHGVILSTHILSEVQAVCNHVQIINRGELVLNTSIAGLEQQMRASSLTLRLEKMPEIGLLKQIPQILEVEVLGEGYYRIFHDRLQNPAPEIARQIVQFGWGLLELTPERRSMEEIFLEITRGDAQPEEAQS
jgi:ABC-2 type transport system ATP-binding protein